MKQTLLILMYALPMAVAAQVPAVPIGTRIRVESREMGRVTGTLVAQTADSLVLEDARRVRTSVSANSVRQLSTSLGRSHGKGALKGSAYGALILGGGLGTLALTSSEPEWAPLVAGVFGFYGGIIGAGIGAVVGSEHWAEVRAVFSGVSVQAAPGSARGIGVRIGF